MSIYRISEEKDRFIHKVDKLDKKEDHFIEITDPLIINTIDEAHINEFSEFVYHVYLHDYTSRNDWEPNDSSLQSMIEEDHQYFKYSFYIICSTKQAGILGTFKITKRNELLTFPIETDFGIKIDELTQFEGIKVDSVWHFGRLAVDKEKIRQYGLKVSSMEIFTRLLSTAIRLLGSSTDNLVVTEIDYKVLRFMLYDGLNMEIIGQPKFYLGSFTCPAIVTSNDLFKWLERNESKKKNTLVKIKEYV